MNKKIYILPAFLLSAYACGSGASGGEHQSVATEERKIDGHQVQITAQQFQRAGGANGEPITYISYTLKVDGRDSVDEVGYVTPLQAEKPADALKVLDIRFSKDGEHMQAKVNAKGGYSTFFHLLKDGPPFRLVFREANHDLWANKGLEEFPTASIMADSIVKGRRHAYLSKKSLTEFHSAIKFGVSSVE
ncbi:MAG: hypothetical protein ACHQF2_11165 [Flavobacteriales bacterium]